MRWRKQFSLVMGRRVPPHPPQLPAIEANGIHCHVKKSSGPQVTHEGPTEPVRSMRHAAQDMIGENVLKAKRIIRRTRER